MVFTLVALVYSIAAVLKLVRKCYSQQPSPSTKIETKPKDFKNIQKCQLTNKDTSSIISFDEYEAKHSHFVKENNNYSFKRKSEISHFENDQSIVEEEKLPSKVKRKRKASRNKKRFRYYRRELDNI